MLLRHRHRHTTTATASAAAALFSLLKQTISKQFSTTTASNLSKPFSKVPYKHRSKAIESAQKALTDYLHTTRYLPFIYAELIGRNSNHSLWKIASKIQFLPSTFHNSFQRFLRYHPINELDFFLESIGLDLSENGKNPQSLYLSDWKQFDAACALASLGFPWKKLGLLYSEDSSIFEIDSVDLGKRVGEIKSFYGFSSVNLIGICLVWPRVLASGMEDLLSDLKVIFIHYDLASCVEGNVDAMLAVCRKIQLFYEAGCEVGKVGEVMGRNKSVFLNYCEVSLRKKIDYFCKLNVRRDELGLFLITRPEIFEFDVDSRVISVFGFLEHFGLTINELKYLEQKYPHVFGRNKMANLPSIIRCMNLDEWFFKKMKNGDHILLTTYAIRHVNEDFDKHYEENLTKIRAKRTYPHTVGKLNFLHRIGFGENKFAVKVLALLNSSGDQLQQRFDYLLNCGVEYSKLCAMVRLSGKILNQNEIYLEQKLEFLCGEMKSELDYLEIFPGYLCYDLEKRIKPRYRLHKWLVEKGFCKKEYSISTIIATSDKTFIARISRIHPDAVKKWREGSLD